MNNWCIICEEELQEATRSREHLIPAALGGKKTTTRALCTKCNNVTGTQWDSVLEIQLRHISIMLEAPNKKLLNKSRIVKGEDGQEIILKRKLRGGAVGPVLLTRPTGNSTEVYLSAESKPRLRQELARLVKQGTIDASDADDILATMERVEVETEVEFEEYGAIGGPDAFNSMLKCMMNAGCEAGLTLHDMFTAREALRGRLPHVMWIPVAVSGIQQCQEHESWLHCVHVETDLQENRTWGYLELYGTYRYLAILGQDYLGDEKTFTYCLDPQTSQEIQVAVDLGEPKKVFRRAEHAPASYSEVVRENQGDPTALMEWAKRKYEVHGQIAIAHTSFGMEQPTKKARILKVDTKLR